MGGGGVQREDRDLFSTDRINITIKTMFCLKKKKDDSERQQKSRRCLFLALCKVCGKQIVSEMVKTLHPQCNLVTTHGEIIDVLPTVFIYSPPFLTLSPIRTHPRLSVDVTAPPAAF